MSVDYLLLSHGIKKTYSSPLNPCNPKTSECLKSQILLVKKVFFEPIDLFQ